MNNLIRLAVQEHLLIGQTLMARLQYARRLHLDGVELAFDGLSERMSQVMEALSETKVIISAIDVGAVPLLHPDYAMREHAIITLREAMTLAVDLGAEGVTFIPQTITTPRLPDLHPYKSTIELEAELLVTMLRTTLCDFADAFGIQLHLMVGNRYQTHLIQKLAHAERILANNNHHPMLKIGANLFNMGMEEDDIITALRATANKIGYFQVAYRHEVSHAMPPDVDAMSDSLAYSLDSHTYPVINALREGGYKGWVTLAGGMKRDSDLHKYASLLQNMLTTPLDEAGE